MLPYKPYELEIRARYRLIVELVFKETSPVTCKEVTFPHFIVIGVVSFIKFATNKPPGKKLTSINLQIKIQLFNVTKRDKACFIGSLSRRILEEVAMGEWRY